MANFLLICDPDSVRRENAASLANDRVAFLPRLRAGKAFTPDYAIVWASASEAPIQHHRSAQPRSGDCMLFGEPHGESGHAVSAMEIARRHDEAWESPNAFNGYYAALLIHPTRGVRIEGDVLGVFPIYYWRRGEVLLVASSPELFRCHAAFESRTDLHGVAALLLTSGIVGGRTLWRDVRRLGADHILLCPRGGDAREIAAPLPAPESVVANSDDAVLQASSLHRSFLRAALRSAKNPGMLLSGGLDSRLLAGFAGGLGLRPQCLTFGRTEDLDARCATQVARELDWPQMLCEVDPEDYAGHACSSVTWEQLSGGLYALPMGWNLSLRPPDVSVDRMMCGLTLDAVIGGAKHVANSVGGISFDALRIARLGYARKCLEPLVASPELRSACDDVRDELVQEYLVAGADDYQREWRMNLAHRHRFAVGTCAWRYSLFAWPVMPALDRRLLRLAARVPGSVAKNRQIQTRMLISLFPQLARLELDRNYLDTIPLLGAKRSFFFDVRRRLVKFERRCRGWLGNDPRFYVRTMELNSPGWRVVRSLADEARAVASGLFRRDALDRLLPESKVTIRRIEDPIIHSAPLKNTLGLILWMRQHA